MLRCNFVTCLVKLAQLSEAHVSLEGSCAKAYNMSLKIVIELNFFYLNLRRRKLRHHIRTSLFSIGVWEIKALLWFYIFELLNSICMAIILLSFRLRLTIVGHVAVLCALKIGLIECLNCWSLHFLGFEGYPVHLSWLSAHQERLNHGWLWDCLFHRRFTK